MERLETIIKHDFSRFDTPKKINRSSLDINQSIIDKIESGKFTSEMLEDLANSVPVFRYKSCVTIHGNFPDINIERIGKYKNIIQNANGSLEVRYSAIDQAKIATVWKYLKDINSNFSLIENSNSRYIQISTQIDENIDEIKEKYFNIAYGLDNNKIFGHFNMYIGSLYGAKFAVMEIHLLAIKEGFEMDFVLNLEGISINEYNERKEFIFEERRLKNEKWEIENSELEKKIEERKREIDKAKEPYLIPLAELKEASLAEGIICRLVKLPNMSDKILFEYEFYRISGKGAFGMVQIQCAECSKYPANLSQLVWDNHKQSKIEDIKLFGFLVKKDAYTSGKDGNITKIIKSNSDLKLIDYTEKSVVLIGNTFQIKSSLGKIGNGLFSRSLTIDEEPATGWIFPKSKIQALKKLINA